jgi:cellulose synthase/poly-beta-1,6-N-acetylglucosamine synthase-like glycosyltransferase
MEGTDLLDIKKSTFRCSFLEKLVHYEYLGSSLVSWFFSKYVGKTLGLNGAAFAIKREAFERLGGFRRTLVDDFDLATRSFVENMSFRYTDKLSVSIKPQPGWNGWFKQRRRWGIATGVWMKDHHKLLAKVLVRKPQVMLPSLLLIMPSLLLVFFSLLLPDTLCLCILTLILSVLSRQPNFVPLTIFLTTFGIITVKNGIVAALSYATLSGIFYLAARKLGYHFNPIEFLGYYLIYSPLSLLMSIIGIFRVMTFNDVVDLDWKV